MLKTANYLKVKMHDYDYLFFLLTEDYITSQIGMNNVISNALDEFARDLGEHGLVVTPSKGDGKATKSQLLVKNWTDEELLQIRRSPGILMIQKDLDIFDPRSDHWYYISFQDIMNKKGEMEIVNLIELLSRLADASKNKNVFDITDEIAHNNAMRELYNAFEFRPGAFGLSFDVKKGLRFLDAIIKK
jgi:hypothetical protein